MAKATLTGRLEYEICALVALGVPLGTAARAAGVPPKTVRDWYVLGRKPDAAEHWAQFAESVDAARREHARKVVVQLELLRGRLD